MRIAYLNYGAQSGVTPNIASALEDLGHDVVSLDPPDVLAVRHPETRLPRMSAQLALALACSAFSGEEP